MVCIIASGGFIDMRIINISMTSQKVCDDALCACIGYFDGCHRGHQALMDKTISLARKHGCESALITFNPDPWTAIYGKTDIKHISTMKQRVQRAAFFGIDNTVILEFTKEMSELSHDEFARMILGKLNLKGLVCGFDFHYGYKGKGNGDTLRQDVDCEVAVVDAVNDEEGKISSTRISTAIEEGRIDKVNEMLGYEYEIEGVVKHGAHKGTQLGFPTANLDYSDEYILPKTGVYACYAQIGAQKYRAMVNIGHNPTLNFSARISIEAHLIDDHEDLYGKSIKLSFIGFVRDERKFPGAEELVAQLQLDLDEVKRMLRDYEQGN